MEVGVHEPVLRRGDLLRMGLRASLLQATWNFERQQGIGLAWALQAGLKRIVPDAAQRCRRLAMHTSFFNTQPSLASLAIGVAARIEEDGARAEGVNDEELRRAMNVMGASLASLGDRLFWFALRPVAACIGLLMIPFGPWAAALGLWVSYNAVHQFVRLGGVGWGYRLGPAVMSGPLRPRLEALRHGLLIGGVALVGVLLAGLIAPQGVPRPLGFQVALGGGLAFGFIAAQRARPSPTEWALVIGAAALGAAWWG